MKKITLLLAGLCFLAMAFATDLTGCKVYINPGHGGWNEMNDRHMPTIPYPQYTTGGMIDTLGFWESSSNLKVAMDLDTLLRAANCQVLLSRYDNRSGSRDNGEMDWDKQKKHYTDDPMIGDRPFSSIKEECYTWGGDYLLSIHSNASSRGIDDTNVLHLYVPGDGTVDNWMYCQHIKDQATLNFTKSVWKYMTVNNLDSWSQDCDPASVTYFAFYDEYTMVKADAKTPTVLCEASFHSYMPNTHRYLNRDYQKLEAYRFYYAFCDLYNADNLSTGVLAGDVRSANLKETRSGILPFVAQPKNHEKHFAHDKWKAMDGSKVELIQDGSVIKTYITDNCCNGIYAFYNLQPGDYQVRINAKHAVEKIENVTVVAGTTTTINSYVTDSAYMRPVTPDYPNQAEDAEFPAKFNMIEHPVVATPFLDGLNIRRMLTRGEKTYVLDDQSHIYIVNTYTGAQIGQLSTQGATEGLRAISDIAFTSDTVLLACNMQKIAKTDTKAHINIYKWANDQANPKILYTINHAGGYTEAELGGTMTVCGNIWWHKLFVSAVSADTKRQISIIGVENYYGEQDKLKYMMSTKSYTEAKWGADFRLSIAANDENETYLLVDSKDMEATEFFFDFNATDRSPMEKMVTITDSKLAKESYGINFLQYASHFLMVTPVCDAGGLNYRLQLNDMPMNSASSYIISVTNHVTDPLPQNGLNASPVNFVHTASVVDGEDLNLVIYLKGIGIARYATRLYSGIEEVSAEQLDGMFPAYDLMGRMVDVRTFRGIVIQNGQKYLLK